MPRPTYISQQENFHLTILEMVNGLMEQAIIEKQYEEAQLFKKVFQHLKRKSSLSSTLNEAECDDFFDRLDPFIVTDCASMKPGIILAQSMYLTYLRNLSAKTLEKIKSYLQRNGMVFVGDDDDYQQFIQNEFATELGISEVVAEHDSCDPVIASILKYVVYEEFPQMITPQSIMDFLIVMNGLEEKVNQFIGECIAGEGKNIKNMFFEFQQYLTLLYGEETPPFYHLQIRDLIQLAVDGSIIIQGETESEHVKNARAPQWRRCLEASIGSRFIGAGFFKLPKQTTTMNFYHPFESAHPVATVEWYAVQDAPFLRYVKSVTGVNIHVSGMLIHDCMLEMALTHNVFFDLFELDSNLPRHNRPCDKVIKNYVVSVEEYRLEADTLAWLRQCLDEFLQQNEWQSYIIIYKEQIKHLHFLLGNELPDNFGNSIDYQQLCSYVCSWLLGQFEPRYGHLAQLGVEVASWESLLMGSCLDMARQKTVLKKIMDNANTTDFKKNCIAAFAKLDLNKLELVVNALRYDLLCQDFLDANQKIDFRIFFKQLSKKNFAERDPRFTTIVFKFLLNIYKDYRRFRYDVTKKGYSNKWGRLFGESFYVKEKAVDALLLSLKNGQSLQDFLRDAKFKPYYKGLIDGRLGELVKFFSEVEKLHYLRPYKVSKVR